VITPVSAAYNFTLSGVGNYSIKPSNLFTHVDVDGSPKDLYATVEDIAEVRLSGNLIASRVLNRRTGVVSGCTEDQSSEIHSAIYEADFLITGAIRFLDNMNQNNPPSRWTTWFGVLQPCRKIFVRNVFTLMEQFGLINFNYDCGCNRPDLTSYLRAYIFQSWDYCYSVTDRSLD